MPTLTLQCVSAVLTVLFAAVALSISRHAIAPDRRAGWRLAGAGFLLLGAGMTAQYAGAVAAFASGPGTAAWDVYLRWAPALNHSRIGGGIALAAGVGYVAWTGRFPERRAWAGLAAGMEAASLAAAWLGTPEGAFALRTHGSSLALGVTVELVAFGAALLVSAARGTLDAFLFAALTLYAGSLALGVPVVSLMVLRTGVEDGRPPSWLLQLVQVVSMSSMMALALLRLTLLRRGVRMRAVLGRHSAPHLHLRL
jgi:hypothetical protein